METFEIECGEHKGVIEARSFRAAWKKLTAGKTNGFASLARYRVLTAGGRRVWHYITPQAIDGAPRPSLSTGRR